MKTKEFIEKVEALGYEVGVGSFETDMNISDSDGHELAIVSKNTDLRWTRTCSILWHM